jgi:hypothetical protein
MIVAVFSLKIKNMASRRTLKRNLNGMIFDIVEECFTVQLFDSSKTEKAEQIIDEAAAFQDDMLSKINKAKTRADFQPIQAEFEAAAERFIVQLNGLN